MTHHTTARPFIEPTHLSTFTLRQSSDVLGWHNLRALHIVTTPGYNGHPLPQHVIGLHLGGTQRIYHERAASSGVQTFQRGTVIVTPAGAPIHYANDQLVDALYLYLAPAYVNEVAAALGLAPGDGALADAWGVPDPALYRLGELVLAELIAPALGGTLVADALAQQLVVHLLRRYAAHPAPAAPVPPPTISLRPVLEYIDAHLAEPLSLARLASVVALSPYHFSRVFRAAIGVPPHQYVLRQRVLAAQRLLHNPRITVAEAATRVGFASHSHLTRHFKRVLGRPPRAP